MSVYSIKEERMPVISPLFNGWEESLIWSTLQGCMGGAFADSEENPESARIINGDFCFLAGAGNEELVRNRPSNYQSDFIIMVPQHKEWGCIIEEVYGAAAKKVTRYAIKKEKDVFDRRYLNRVVDQLDERYELRLIDEYIYEQAMSREWSGDLCGNFKDYQSYREKGLGAAVLLDGRLVSGASSYIYYKEGIEIEIDTLEGYRRRGLALACGAKLILACLERGWYPSWDAHNKGSVALAEKLGYHFDKEYTAYEVFAFGKKEL